MNSSALRPKGRLGRFAWLLAGLLIVAALFQLVGSLLQTPPTSLNNWGAALGWGLAIPVVFSILAALIIGRQPGNRVGWLMMLVALMTVEPLGLFIAAMSGPPAALTPGLWLLLWVENGSWIPLIFAIVLIPLHFPTGRPPTPRWQWVNWMAVALWLFFLVLSAFFETVGPADGTWMLLNPIGFVPQAVVDGPVLIIWGIGLVSVIVASVTSLFVRYRRAAPIEREQIKWLLYAGAFFTLSYALTYFLTPPDNDGSAWGNLWLVFSILALPVAIAIAILRYRLYDIDIIIRRTLLYTLLTALLALFFFGSVILLQRLFEAVTGQQSQLAIVLSTLAIAVLFNPLRTRIQAWIDRRFYRKKYDAQQVLAHFAITARDETDMNALTAELARVVQETLEPEQVRLWLRKG